MAAVIDFAASLHAATSHLNVVQAHVQGFSVCHRLLLPALSLAAGQLSMRTYVQVQLRSCLFVSPPVSTPFKFVSA
jgi:hypothetical protein